ncbi:MAG: hypothetical protein ACYDHX_05235 [Methanothrix sp.]
MKTAIDQAREKVLWQILEEVRDRVGSGDFLRLVHCFRERGEQLANLALHVGTTLAVTETLADEYDAIIFIPSISRPKKFVCARI